LLHTVYLPLPEKKRANPRIAEKNKKTKINYNNATKREARNVVRVKGGQQKGRKEHKLDGR